MDSSQDRLSQGAHHAATQFSRRSQQATMRAVEIWAESIKRITDTAAAADSGPTLEEAVNTAFRFAEQLLSAQKELTLDLVRALTAETDAPADRPLAPKASTPVEDATKTPADPPMRRPRYE
jgi:hypothetical protein